MHHCVDIGWILGGSCRQRKPEGVGSHLLIARSVCPWSVLTGLPHLTNDKPRNATRSSKRKEEVFPAQKILALPRPSSTTTRINKGFTDRQLLSHCMMEDISPQASLSLGDSYYVDEDYSQAADAYAAALSVVRESEANLHIRALSHRSSTFYQLGRYEEALEDATSALSILSRGPSGLRPGEGELCHKRVGLAAFKLERYTEAIESLKQAARLASLNNRPDHAYLEWISQCDERLDPPKKKAASNEGSAFDKMEIETTETTPPRTAAPVAASSAGVSRAAATNRNAATSRPTMPKYQYYQSDQVMTISILEAGVVQENLRVNFEPKKLTVTLRKGGIDFTVIAGHLYSKIDVDKSKTVIKDEKVLIKLRKVEKFEWHELFGKPDENVGEPTKNVSPADKVEDTTPRHVDPKKTRPYASHRDWDAIERDLEQQEKKEKPEGDEALNALFKQIYGNADEDTRRAMIKSYQTSGGTVLSTNWDEVSKKNYEEERTAPSGMEWKTWEGNKLPMKEDD